MIRKIRSGDREEYLKMARAFYDSDAVLFHVDTEYLEATFDELMRSDVYAECYIIEKDGETAGYGLLAKTFSQEAGGINVWLEELYIRDRFRSEGLGSEFFRFVENELPYPVKRFRLEVEEYNVRALSLYERLGYKRLDYVQLIKDIRK